ncbi:uncharacterized protein LOC129941173 [Eupeodes corollae]|uniref:uncharacterized protein LOC129941173 n=1 Tax=Eupeodes corollae TaxID=290404 RepID=UPI002491B198|nr:uncharacterized protein LOC129941173 [Eupeodes corollae]
MSFPQGYHRVYQQEFIEVIQQCNFLPFQNYQYPRYEYSAEQNKLDYRPLTNLPFFSQCYGEFQVPQQINLLDYNNFRSHRNFESTNKLEITEYFDSDEENKEGSNVGVRQSNVQHKTTQAKVRGNSDYKQLPPNQCDSEQPQCQLDVQSQSQLGQLISEISNKTNNNHWKIVSTHSNSEERDVHQFYENTCSNSTQESQHFNKDNQLEPRVVQSQNIYPGQELTETIQRNNQVKSYNNAEQGCQELSQIAQFVKNNCNIHDVKFGKLKSLNGRLYRTGSLLINFGDHYKVQVIGDVILNSIDENTAFDAFFSPSPRYQF